MNKTKKILLGASALVVLFVTLALGQVLNLLPLPATWAASDGNYFRLTSTATPEIKVGTNTYTGATTNVYLTNIYQLRITKGIVTGIIAPE
ncbi:MAG: hypothetical protein KIS67_20295 [Verrucomicrobiae bacterium]|nr:hypothetical protein [Verrucomicrobiae bacterium]